MAIHPQNIGAGAKKEHRRAELLRIYTEGMEALQTQNDQAVVDVMQRRPVLDVGE
jgi:hypothetical protein